MSRVQRSVPTTSQNGLSNVLLSVSKARIFFAHQSVGVDILNGLNDLSRECAIPLNMVETDHLTPDQSPIFAHARVGRNGDPRSKLIHFTQMLDNGVGNNVGVAILKLCYVDVTAATKVDELIEHDLQLFESLVNSYPHLKLVYCTVPLTARQRGLKAIAARALARTDAAIADNRARTIYNEAMRSHCVRNPYLFDLAQAEMGNGPSRTSLLAAREEPPSLHPTYTDDCGHLNRQGRRIVAEALVRTLGRILR